MNKGGVSERKEEDDLKFQGWITVVVELFLRTGNVEGETD